MNATAALVLVLVAQVPAGAPAQLPPPPDVASPPAGAIKTPSGVALKILRPGRGTQHPQANDCVKLHFSAWKRDGTFLSDSRHWGDPLELYDIVKAPPTPRNLKAPPARAIRMPSGLAIESLKRGSGATHPQESNQVLLHFSGWTTDGRLIESSVMARHAAIFPMTGLMRGWHDALLQMAVGDKVRIWIPRDLAFGAKPARGQPKGDLVYELELLEIQ
ncbi:MAG TPA: FKBP-type peptidyl-prolyl cis-trans isomerase [Polyangia bacterium]